MRKKHTFSVEIPEGVSCDIKDSVLECKKENVALQRKIYAIGTDAVVKDGKITFTCEKANKKNVAIMGSYASHIKNMFRGLEKSFVYELEICNVHFPITVKIEGGKILISNFLGEKINRSAKILGGVEVEIKGHKITVSGPDIERTGQTAANIEKASKVSNKDRRIFQDGIFITNKPGGAI